MSESPALIPNEIRAVEFYGDEIVAALVMVDGEARIYVPLRPICDSLGLTWSGQFERIQRDEVLASEAKSVRIIRTDDFVRVTRTKSRRGDPNVLCLPLEFLPGWLFGIGTGRITKPGLRERIILYRRECYRRLWEAFKFDVLHAVQPAPAIQPSGAALAYELATAVQNLAREQMDMEQRLTSRLNQAAQWARGIESRVTALELHLSDEHPITEAQAADLALAVKNVAYALEQQGIPNGYQRVYGELYRQQGITSYKSLPQRAYESVMTWLSAWHAELDTR